MSEVGFGTMGQASGADEVQPIGVGMLGYAFMGKAHSNAYKTLAYMTWPPPLVPQPGRDLPGATRTAVAEAARRYGFAEHVHRLAGAARRRRRRSCSTTRPEQPPRRADDRRGRGGQAHHLREAARLARGRVATRSGSASRQAGVKHMCAFNYRFVPAVRLARQIIESGDLGEIYHFRGVLPAGVGRRPDVALWRFDKEAGRLRRAGRPRRAHHRPGALPGRRASSQCLAAIDRDVPARGTARSTTRSRRPSGFENGAVGTLEATRFASGRKNAFTVGDQRRARARIAFDLERLNELQVHFADSSPGRRGTGLPRRCWSPRPTIPSGSTGGPRATSSAGSTPSSTSCTTSSTPSATTETSAPHGATFEDGYRAAEVCDAMLRSAEEGGREPVTYR